MKKDELEVFFVENKNMIYSICHKWEIPRMQFDDKVGEAKLIITLNYNKYKPEYKTKRTTFLHMCITRHFIKIRKKEIMRADRIKRLPEQYYEKIVDSVSPIVCEENYKYINTTYDSLREKSKTKKIVELYLKSKTKEEIIAETGFTMKQIENGITRFKVKVREEKGNKENGKSLV